MKCRGLECCTLAALAEAQLAIKRLRIKTHRIIFALPPNCFSDRGYNRPGVHQLF